MVANFGLYYPFIHFKDDNWLKLSAIYFDKMYRIVPSTYATEDSETVKELGDFVDEIRPDWARPEFGRTFVEFIDQYHDRLGERYGLWNLETWPTVPQEYAPPSAGGGSGTDPRLSHVYFEKITPKLRDSLIHSGLAKLDEEDERWVGMHPSLARVYMTGLADQLAGERGLQPMTDETIDHLALSGLSPERLAQLLLKDVALVGDAATEHEIEQTLALMAVQAVIPKNLSAVQPAKIVALRETFAGERGKFQESVVNLANKHGDLKDMKPDVIRDHLQAEFNKSIKPELDKLREALRATNIDAAFGAMNLKVELPLLISAWGVAGIAAPAMAPVLGALGIAYATARVYHDRRKRRQKELANSPVAYLLRVEEALSPDRLVSWVGQDAGRIVAAS